jgi:hypothetical protein
VAETSGALQLNSIVLKAINTKALGKKERANGLNRIQRVRIISRWITGATRKDSLRRAYCVVACGGGGSYGHLEESKFSILTTF